MRKRAPLRGRVQGRANQTKSPIEKKPTAPERRWVDEEIESGSEDDDERGEEEEASEEEDEETADQKRKRFALFELFIILLLTHSLYRITRLALNYLKKVQSNNDMDYEATTQELQTEREKLQGKYYRLVLVYIPQFLLFLLSLLIIYCYV